MEYLYAPWRGTYLTRDNPLKQPKDQKTCIFCTIPQSEDKENFILKKARYSYILLNSFPYNPGHLLIIPYEHVSSLENVSKEARAEIMELMAASLPILTQSLGNAGANIGINIGGKSAGGTIPEHLHIHVLPRWEGDTNFLPALAQTKQLSADLKEVYNRLAPAFNELVIE